MTNAKLALGALILSLFSVVRAEAQTTIDIAKVTGEQFILYQVVNSDYVGVCLHAYYSTKHDNRLVDVQAFKADASKVRDYCRTNLKATAMQAAEAVLGTGK
jgi:hypothetical protein